MSLLLLCFCSFLVLLSCISSEVVNTQYGQVRGSIKSTETGRTYFNFQGIPYARAPVGNLKFRVTSTTFFYLEQLNISKLFQDAQPPIPWHNQPPLNCTTQGPPFWGINGLTGEIVGSFDALHVNVYTNNIRPESPYPVMVRLDTFDLLRGHTFTCFFLGLAARWRLAKWLIHD